MVNFILRQSLSARGAGSAGSLSPLPALPLLLVLFHPLLDDAVWNSQEFTEQVVEFLVLGRWRVFGLHKRIVAL